VELIEAAAQVPVMLDKIKSLHELTLRLEGNASRGGMQ
jgi:hypothetical protein